MSTFSAILFWIGVVFLADGSLGLVFEDKWKRIVSGVRIRLLALIEIGLAALFLAAHFFLVP